MVSLAFRNAAVENIRNGFGSGGCYVIRPWGVGPVKIGFATCIANRFDDLRGMMGEFQIISVMPGGRQTESYLHKRFHSWRVDREWFHPSVIPLVRAAAAELVEFLPSSGAV